MDVDRPESDDGLEPAKIPPAETVRDGRPPPDVERAVTKPPETRGR